MHGVRMCGLAAIVALGVGCGGEDREASRLRGRTGAGRRRRPPAAPFRSSPSFARPTGWAASGARTRSRSGLQESDLEAGRDYELKVSSAQGDLATLPSLIDAAVDAKAAVIVTLQDATLQAAVQRVKTAADRLQPAVRSVRGRRRHQRQQSPAQHHRRLFARLRRSGADQAGRADQADRAQGAHDRRAVQPGGDSCRSSFKDRHGEGGEEGGPAVVAVPVSSVSDVGDAARSLCGKKVGRDRALRQRGPRRIREPDQGGEGVQGAGVLALAVRGAAGRHRLVLPGLPGGRRGGGQDDRAGAQGREPGVDSLLPVEDHQAGGQSRRRRQVGRHHCRRTS